ncbi:MAG: DUF4115 domain-containing protein [Desulfovibrio sp.]|nr:DUF4115 domain-containing protein [Desulfovibrio sp.]
MATAFQELGGKIREKREAAGLSIEDVAARIKISSRILKAIEEGVVAGLPHAVYTKRFTKAFGLLVGYDPEELDARLEDIFQAACLEEAKHESVLNRNADLAYPGTARRFMALVVFILMLWGLAGGCWYIAVNYGSAIIEFVKQPFSAFGGQTDTPPSGGTSSDTGIGNAVSRLMRPQADKGPAQAVLQPDGDKQQSAEASPRVQNNGPPEPSGSPPRLSDPPAQAGGNASGTGPENTQPVPGEGGSQNGAVSGVTSADGERAAPGGNNLLLITSREPCWISSRADGVKGRDQVLKPGDSFVLTYNNELELILGNAGGVDLAHNGKQLGPGGRRGQRAVLHFPEKAR